MNAFQLSNRYREHWFESAAANVGEIVRARDEWELWLDLGLFHEHPKAYLTEQVRRGVAGQI